LLLMRRPVQGHHVLGNEFSEREVRLIGGRRAPGFHRVTSFEETPDLIIEGALPSAAPKVVPNRDPHLCHSLPVLKGHLSGQNGGPATLLPAAAPRGALRYLTLPSEGSPFGRRTRSACLTSSPRTRGRQGSRSMHREPVSAKRPGSLSLGGA